jgi:hypothetical protein
MMPKATFRLANGANISEMILYSVEVEQAVPDSWLQDAQNYFAENLPPGITWQSVHKYSLQVQEDREIDPNP